MFKDRIIQIALAVSILLHLLLFLFFKPMAQWLNLTPDPPQPADQPLTVELVDPNDTMPQDLVETPDDAQVDEPVDNPQALSDKTARAQDQQENDQITDEPFSDGPSDYKTFSGGGQPGTPAPRQPPRLRQQQTDEQQQEEQESELEPEQGETALAGGPFRNNRPRRFSKELLSGSPNPSQPGDANFSDDADWNNRGVNAEALGGVSLSTYNWNYAPYILYMKRRIRDHLYPPPAFMRDGAISGKVRVKFSLKRDGSVRNLQLMDYQGHEAFIDPCMNAIRASDAFKPLPSDFPDPNLELTWTFIFTIYQ